jgi:hypothetical protein
MKKIVLPVILLLLVGGIANAQTAAKQPAKTAIKPASSITVAHPAATKTTGNTVSKANSGKATPATPASPAKNGMATRRKHHHAPKKTKTK